MTPERRKLARELLAQGTVRGRSIANAALATAAPELLVEALDEIDSLTATEKCPRCRLRADIRLELAPSLEPGGLAAEFGQDLERWLESWLRRLLSYHPDARAIETVHGDEQLELHLNGKVLAVVHVSVVSSAP